jgi:LPS O-antigen subunit length determinant protein (WzzB/FepE family)
MFPAGEDNSVARDLTHTDSVEEFLQLRGNIKHSTTLLEQLDDQLRDMARSEPDRAAGILDTLSHSDDKDDRDTAAIYVGHLLATRPNQAQNIIRLLLHDSEEDIRRQVQDTLDAAIEDDTITAIEAARLHQRRTSDESF